MLVDTNALYTVPDYARKTRINQNTVREIVRFFGVKPVKKYGTTFFYRVNELDTLFEKLRNIQEHFNDTPTE